MESPSNTTAARIEYLLDDSIPGDMCNGTKAVLREILVEVRLLERNHAAMLEALTCLVAWAEHGDTPASTDLAKAQAALAQATPKGNQVRCCANDRDVIEAGNHCTCSRCTEDE